MCDANDRVIAEVSAQRKLTSSRPAYQKHDLIFNNTARHDDITYQSIAKAFNLPLILHQEAFERMKRISKPNKQQPDFSWDEDSPARKARLRMVELPIDESRDLKSISCPAFRDSVSATRFPHDMCYY
jgi:hypothetical protein